jgi:hypothetical protein
VRDRALAFTGRDAAAAPAVASVADQLRFDPSRFRLAAHQGNVGSVRRVIAELIAEMFGGNRIAGEDDQSAGVAIQPVHGNDSSPAFCLGSQQSRQKVGERRGQKTLAASTELGSFVTVSHGGQPRGLFHNDDMVVGVAKLNLRMDINSRLLCPPRPVPAQAASCSSPQKPAFCQRRRRRRGHAP